MKIRIRKANKHAWVCVLSLLGLPHAEYNAIRDYIDELRQQARWDSERQCCGSVGCGICKPHKPPCAPIPPSARLINYYG